MDRDSPSGDVGGKRRATSVLEKEPAKRVESASAGTRDQAPSSAGEERKLVKRAEQASAGTGEDEAWSRAGGTAMAVLESRVREQAAELERLQTDLTDVTEERDEWRVQAARLQVVADKSRTKHQCEDQARAAELKDVSKKVAEGVKGRWETKLQRQKKALEERIGALRARDNKKRDSDAEKWQKTLDERVAAHKKNREALDAKHAKEVEDLKSKIQEMRQKHRDVQAELKTAQREEIKELKPEYSNVLKEKDKLSKELQNKLGTANHQVKELTARVARQSDDLIDLGKVLDTAKAEQAKLIYMIREQGVQSERLLQVIHRMTKKYEEKRERDARRYEIKYNEAETNKRNSIRDARTCAMLGVHVGRLNQKVLDVNANLEKLTARLTEAETELEMLRPEQAVSATETVAGSNREEAEEPTAHGGEHI